MFVRVQDLIARSVQGELPDGTEVAVRRLPLNSRQGKREFAKGVKNMMEAHHRNVVRLVGCCYTTSRLLVYEYLSSGNLAQILFGAHMVRETMSLSGISSTQTFSHSLAVSMQTGISGSNGVAGMRYCWAWQTVLPTCTKSRTPSSLTVTSKLGTSCWTRS